MRKFIRRLSSFFTPRRNVVYGEEFFSPGWFEAWQKLAPVLRGIIETQPQWRSILDFACGPGIMIDVMNDGGWNYVGCERSSAARDLYLKSFGRYPEKYFTDLTDLKTQRFDVLLSFDVFEHLTDPEVIELLAATENTPEIFVNISRTQGIPGHINLKNDTQWVALFAKAGLRLDDERTQIARRKYKELRPMQQDLWNQNMFIFTRREKL